MSQIGISRPSTQQSFGRGSSGHLPEIKHPLSRLGNPEKLDVRGMSRGGIEIGGVPSALSTGRSMGAEPAPPPSPGKYRLGTSAGRAKRVSKENQPPPLKGIEAIPEGVEVTSGDPNKPRIPIFGNSAELSNRAELASQRESRVASRLSTANSQARLEIDELEMLLKEKMKTNYFEVKRRFRDSDPEGKGNVSKDALYRVVVTVTNRPINGSQFGKLMDRLGFKDRTVINFSEFFSVFRDIQSSEYPRWMDPVQRQWQERATMNATQVHLHLKEKAKQRVKDIVELIPQSNPDGSGHILKPELRNALNQMGFYMDDIEFEKLWQKYDNDNNGVLNGEKLMKKLGIAFDGEENRTGSAKPLRRKEVERQRSLDIEKWLKNKFREGFREMKIGFEDADPEKRGEVSYDTFLKILGNYGLKLEKAHLGEFLARCGVDASKTGVPYRDFLHRFLDRSETGMAHKILTNSKHRYNRAESPGNKSTMSALETQLLNMFQRDFLALLGTFHKIDKHGLDFISQEEFRAAIESRFQLEMTDAQFHNLIDRVPLDTDGNVKYADFMAQFDTKGKAHSLFNSDLTKPKVPMVGALPRDPSPPLGPSPPPGFRSPTPPEVDRLLIHDSNELTSDELIPHRNTQELFKIIKDLLRHNYQSVEQTFIDLDEQNTRRLTQEMMYQLLKRFGVDPEITRGEIRDLWKTFITNTDKTLDFLQFTRHFGYSLKSAAFANAKTHPPKRGDSDFRIRSRKLNCAADMLQDSLKSKIDYMWDDLRKEFVAMDPYGTGCVTPEEFRDILQELCVHLNVYELDMLVRKFQIDDRVSYIEFLKPFAVKKQIWRHGNNMLSLLKHPTSELPMPEIVEGPEKGLAGITAKLRNQLSGEWKNLRRAFRKLDEKNTGFTSLPEFRSVLKLTNVILDEEDIYQLMSEFDQDMSGKIPYNKFITETFKADMGRQTPLRKSATL